MGDRTIVFAERLGTYLPSCLCTPWQQVSASHVNHPMAGASLPPSSNLHLGLAGQ